VSDLVELARRYVSLSDELEAVRGEIKLAVLNGGAGAHPTRPTQPARSAGGSHPNAILAQEAEAKIVELLRSTPGLGTTQIANETGSKVNTVTQRLQRLKDRGLIERLDGSGWGAVPVP
jgi:hypothetical protein